MSRTASAQSRSLMNGMDATSKVTRLMTRQTCDDTLPDSLALRYISQPEGAIENTRRGNSIVEGVAKQDYMTDRGMFDRDHGTTPCGEIGGTASSGDV